ATRPVAEHPGREAVVCHDEPRSFGRIVQLSVADRGERQVAQRAAPLPALVTSLGDDALGLGAGVETLQRLEPLDPCEAVPTVAAPLGIEEVVGERSRILVGEAERAEPSE